MVCQFAHYLRIVIETSIFSVTEELNLVDIVGVLRCMLHQDEPSSDSSAVWTFEASLSAYLVSRKGK